MTHCYTPADDFARLHKIMTKINAMFQFVFLCLQQQDYLLLILTLSEDCLKISKTGMIVNLLQHEHTDGEYEIALIVAGMDLLKDRREMLMARFFKGTLHSKLTLGFF